MVFFMETEHHGLEITFKKPFLEGENKLRKFYTGESLLACWDFGGDSRFATIGLLERITKGPHPLHRSMGISGEYFFLHFDKAYEFALAYGDFGMKYKGKERLMACHIFGVYSKPEEQQSAINKLFPGKNHSSITLLLDYLRKLEKK